LLDAALGGGGGLHMLKHGVTWALVTVFSAPCHSRPAQPAGPHAASSATMPLDGWYTLAPQPAAPAAVSVRKPLDTTPVPDGSEWITVFGKHHDRDAEWRGDKAAALPVYEAEHSAAAQRLYAPSPTWDSPEEQRMMSTAKDALGLCGALGGWVTCPNQ
jgi:hypothetical protein